eukprot:15211773-Alexandrium_andersonii.AAC.1
MTPRAGRCWPRAHPRRWRAPRASSRCGAARPLQAERRAGAGGGGQGWASEAAAGRPSPRRGGLRVAQCAQLRPPWFGRAGAIGGLGPIHRIAVDPDARPAAEVQRGASAPCRRAGARGLEGPEEAGQGHGQRRRAAGPPGLRG